MSKELPKIEPKGLDYIPKNDLKTVKEIFDELMKNRIKLVKKVNKPYLDSSLTFSENLMLFLKSVQFYIWQRSGTIDESEIKNNWIISLAKWIFSLLLKLFGIKL